MGQPKELNEEIIMERIRQLPPSAKQEVFDFLDFLSSQGKAREWIEFDEWALNLAKEKRFFNLTEEDVARIVSDFRRQQ
jgi:hypothetical protein